MFSTMNTEITPLSVDFEANKNGDEFEGSQARLTRVSRRALFLVAVVGSLMLIGAAGYAAYNVDNNSQSELSAITEGMGGAEVGQSAIGSDVVSALVGEDVETEEDAVQVGPAPGTLISCGASKYLIMNGKKRWIPNGQTMTNLFGAAGSKKLKPLSKAACAKIPTGKHLTSGARLIKCKGFAHVFLESNRMKRWICNPTTMNTYKFDWKKIKTLPLGQCSNICTGPTICNTQAYKKTSYYTQLNAKLGVQCPAKMIGQYACPPGSHETGVDNLGNCICKLCPAGYHCRGGYRSKLKCPAGTYQPQQGQAICIRSSPGYYVPKTGSKKQFLCPKGQYQYGRGATACRRSNPGTYIVMVNGVATHKKCPKGSYQPKAGQHKCLAASKGYYVGNAGWSTQRPCRPGTYQPKTGSWKCLLASKGYFVPGAGSKMQYKCHFGTYQPKMGQRGCRMATPGHYVGKMGAWKQMTCPAKTYQHCYGQKQCIGCPLQAHGARYLPRNAQKQCGFVGKAGGGAKKTTVKPNAQVNQVQFKPPVEEDVDELYDGHFDGDAKDVGDEDEDKPEEGQ